MTRTMTDAILVITLDDGSCWAYKQGATRITSSTGEEINIWDHATAKPGIAFTPDAIAERVYAWLSEDEPERRLPSTPPGMTDHEWSVERFGYNGENA